MWDEDGVFFVLNEDGRTEKIPTRDLEVDYLYRADSGEGNEVTYLSSTYKCNFLGADNKQ